MSDTAGKVCKQPHFYNYSALFAIAQHEAANFNFEFGTVFTLRLTWIYARTILQNLQILRTKCTNNKIIPR